MSLNYLTCQALLRPDSIKEFHLSGPGPPTVEINHVVGKASCKDHVGGRNWSGNLSPRIYEKIGRSGSYLAQKMKKVKKIHHIRLSGPVGSSSSNGTTRFEQQLIACKKQWDAKGLEF